MAVGFTPDPSLYPFTSHWFDSTRGRVHYIDESSTGGNGVPIVFCHGNPTWSFLYRDIIIALRDKFRCIAPDYLGFGLSERPSGFGYTVEEHAGVVGDLVDHLGLDGYLTMGQDWGGPISLAVDVARADRVRGVILGNTWFWPADGLRPKVFSKVMSSAPMQHAILHRNFFVERLIPAGTSRRLNPAVMAHYRGVQPTRQDRVGVARLPKEILAARPLLERLSTEVPARLGSKPALLVWGMKDPAFPPGQSLPRMRAAFPDHVVVELPNAKHFIQEDAPDRIAEAITERYG
ncbi:haloalkane dehalogenase [Mycobacterium heckeshornense]|uniref:Haloalkane dehalogenase 2 n=1 Tax=Mycobacterium heckeshornense TaxID=110505 RepID=A0A2G8BDP5_9MYCO|nr:haloalkane dehalogenase [Mycobacterium heckeshornense]KMV21494.1 haloalkane dehalogenase [Mycobacterium heckeshornense]MCV7035876.1 haloalkane dehalogenase [Mycobacterium heckeshornense]PIJ35766.1 haloalkane dehalogenase [Mycobacterium heckeshornense]BCO35933.1 haloalkane dehalogenase 2 [Mycobacterium heckeshornense]BCQ09084.1 haloalkane dehalogenase 2 [Mycobacterium heckeshornense]